MRIGANIKLVLCFGLVLALPASSATIGVWSLSERSWNTPFTSNLQAWIALDKHQVVGPADVPTSAMQVFIVSEPDEDATPLMIATMSSWVKNGGRLFLLHDLGLPTAKIDAVSCAITGGLLSFNGCSAFQPLYVLTDSTFPIGSNLFTTRQGHIAATALTGKPAKTSFGMEYNAGLPLVGDYARWMPVGSGVVFAFGDRLDHNALLAPPPLSISGLSNFAIAGADANAALFLSLLVFDIPEPSTIVLSMAGLALLALLRYRK